MTDGASSWHWDEQAALRAELAAQTETAGHLIAAQRAQIKRLEADLEFWREQAAGSRRREEMLRLQLSRLVQRHGLARCGP